jgi:ferric-dicitrate binding protein FerR (iron transport regulator)
MKDKSGTGSYTDREWEELASALSGENGSRQELPAEMLPGDDHDIINQWKGLRKLSDDKEIDVDKAWDNLYTRLNESGSFMGKSMTRTLSMRRIAMRIAAVALLLLSIGSGVTYLLTGDRFSKEIVVATGSEDKNQSVTLPDGSNVLLNRDTRLSYRSGFGKHGRDVALSGEAFFEITPNAEKPFIIHAGQANVKVIGTCFNVITRNINSAVEVFVKTGSVMLFDNSGVQNLILEPGYVGTMDTKISGKTLNSNPNYLSWKTGLLVYDGQTLDVVFRDLKKVYNMEIIADDPDILNETWKVEIDNQSQNTIIRLICTSFNLGYSKDGTVFHLSRK